MGLLFFGILEWSSWSRWRRAVTLYPTDSEIVLMIFTRSLQVFTDPQKGKPGWGLSEAYGEIHGV